MSEIICVFDCGTTGTRTVFFDINGKEISRAYEEYKVPKQPVGISEQDPIIWWNAIKNTCNLAVKKVNSEKIIGICADFHRATTTIVDKNGNVLHPALTWMDEREAADLKEFKEEGGSRRSIPKLLWLKNNKPELFAKAHKIIFPDSYIYMKLLGKNTWITEPTISGIYGIINTKTLKWDENLAQTYNLPIDLWPELHSSGEILGDLSPDAVKALGLKKSVPVVLGGGDQQCSALGLGVVNKGQAKITTGTGTFVDYITGDEPLKPAGDIPIFPLPHVVKGKWIIEGAMPGTGTAFKWFKENFSQLQVKECEEMNSNIYDALTAEAKQVPLGSEGLLFVPLYVFRKGAIHGLGWNHSRAHMIRAIMESAALSGQMYLQLLEGIAKAKTSEVPCDGGAMNSDFWAQMFADILDKKVLIPEVKDGAALGAAILGFCGCKKYANINDAIKKMVRVEKVKEPIKENSKTYRKLTRLFMPTLLEIYNKKRITKDF